MQLLQRPAGKVKCEEALGRADPGLAVKILVLLPVISQLLQQGLHFVGRHPLGRVLLRLEEDPLAVPAPRYASRAVRSPLLFFPGKLLEASVVP